MQKVDQSTASGRKPKPRASMLWRMPSPGLRCGCWSPLAAAAAAASGPTGLFSIQATVGRMCEM
jgi:hypothetical protein